MTTITFENARYTRPTGATNWTHCWRCGKAIPERNTNEREAGIHNRCATRPVQTWRPGDAMIVFDMPPGHHEVTPKITTR